VTGNQPTGTVTFREGTTDLATVTLADGVATYPASGSGYYYPEGGVHTYQVDYSGDSQNPDGASTSITITVNPTDQWIQLMATPPVINPGESTTLSINYGQGTGAVTYQATGSAGLTCTVNGNVLTATGQPGVCQVTATKAADANYKSATTQGSVVVGTSDYTFELLKVRDSQTACYNNNNRWMAMDAAGNIYGTCGSRIYRQTPTGAYTTLHTFGYQQSIDTEGYNPTVITVSPDGTVYGITSQGGTNSDGTLYRLTSDGTFTVLHAFNGQTDGRYGTSLVRASDGTLYGTQQSGGDAGTLYRYGSDGTFTVLHTFIADSALGGGPLGITLSPDGALYGVTAYNDQPNGLGTAYKRSPDGTLTVLYDFNNSPENGRPGPVTLAADGNLYGLSGNNQYTTSTALVYRITPGGQYGVVYTFDANQPPPWGFNTAGTLTLGADGALYGTTYGSIYRVSTGGEYLTMRILDQAITGIGAEGAPLVLGSDSCLYGSTDDGGPYNPAIGNGRGTIYRLCPPGGGSAQVPDAPTAVSAIPGNGQALVSWATPANDGGAVILSYTAIATPSGKTCTASAPNLSCTVTGLTNGVAYTFTARASNALGASLASTPSQPVTPIASINGACGTAAGQSTIVAPNTNLCATGTPSAVSASNGSWYWNCASNTGGTTAECTAPGGDSSGGESGTTLAVEAGGYTVTDAALANPPDGGPAQVNMPYGVVRFTLASTVQPPPRTVTIRLTYPGSLAGMSYYKFINGNWTLMPATISGNTVTFTLEDNGPYDADPAPGFITDPSGPGLPRSNPPRPPNPIPTLPKPMTVLMGLALLILAGVQRRRNVQ
jgi:uncharacterized repeat protein (TIGR03803 family)